MSKLELVLIVVGAGSAGASAALASSLARVRGEVRRISKVLQLSTNVYAQAAKKYEGMVKADARYEELVRLYEKSRQELGEHIRAPIHKG